MNSSHHDAETKEVAAKLQKFILSKKWDLLLDVLSMHYASLKVYSLFVNYCIVWGINSDVKAVVFFIVLSVASIRVKT